MKNAFQLRRKVPDGSALAKIILDQGSRSLDVRLQGVDDVFKKQVKFDQGLLTVLFCINFNDLVQMLDHRA